MILQLLFVNCFHCHRALMMSIKLYNLLHLNKLVVVIYAYTKINKHHLNQRNTWFLSVFLTLNQDYKRVYDKTVYLIIILGLLKWRIKVPCKDSTPSYSPPPFPVIARNTFFSPKIGITRGLFWWSRNSNFKKKRHLILNLVCTF